MGKRLKQVVSVILALMLILPGMVTKPKLGLAADTLDNGTSRPLVAARNDQSFAVTQDGTLWAWGWNSQGELGDGTTTNRKTPTQVMSGVQSVAPGDQHTIALKDDGTVWAWGNNTSGQLGNGTKTDSAIPIQVMDNVKSVAAGWNCSLAIKQDGTLWAWGSNSYGQLGDGTTTSKTTPMQVMSDVKSVSAGQYHTLALKEDGTLWAWGSNTYGQLGDGTTTNKKSPVQIMSGVKGIMAGREYSLVTKQDGTLWSFGKNDYGQLGDGTTTDRTTAVKIMDSVKMVAAGDFHAFSLREDGTLWAWGFNSFAQLGDGSTTNSPNPVQVMSGVDRVAAGYLHSLAIKSDGTLWAWGDNVWGQIGDGTSFNSKKGPLQVMRVKPLSVDNTLSTVVPANAQFIMVSDSETKQPVAGAQVSLGGNSATTDSQGIAKFADPTTGKQSIGITAPGYCDYQSNFTVRLGKADQFFLTQDTDPLRPYISFANLNDGTRDFDLFREEKDYTSISKDEDVTAKDKSTIQLKANWKGKTPFKYILSQNGSSVLESDTGTFDSVAVGRKFKSGYKIYAFVKATDGTISKPAEVKLLVVNPVLSGSFLGANNKNLSLGNKTVAVIGNDVPVLGGTEVNFGLKFIPATLELGKDSFKMAIGVQGLTDMQENWDKFKKTFETAKTAKDEYQIAKTFQKFLGYRSSTLPLISKWSPDVDIAGYAEGVFRNGQPVITKGSVLVNLGAKYTWQSQYIVGPVPVYAEIGGGIKLSTLGEIAKYVPESGDLKLNTELTITPSFELGGGVGVVKVLTVGAVGKADLEFFMRTADAYSKTSLTGSMVLKATALTFEAKKEILKGTWTIAEGYGDLSSPKSVSPDKSFNLYDAKQYSQMPRDYLQRPTVWQGGKTQRDIAANDTTSNQEVKTLQTNIFPNAQPKLAEIGDQEVMVWLADNAARTAPNRTMLVYSVYDRTTDTWSMPQAVNDDNTADFYPAIASNGTELYVVWQNSNKVFSDSVSLQETAAAGEIEVAKFDPGTNSFTAPTALTQNATLDTQPQIALAGNQASVAWTNNSGNDIFGVSGSNTILYSTLTDSWSSPQALASNLNVVPSLSVGFVNNTFSVAYVTDEDNDLNTINDRDIYVAKPGQGITRLTDNQSLDSNPTFAAINGTEALYWYNDGNILYLPNLTGSPQQIFAQSKNGLKDDFTIVNNSLGQTAALWTETENGTSEIHSALYDSAKGEWSDDLQLSNIGSEIRFPNGILDKDGNFNLAFNKLITLQDGSEQADLCVLKAIPAYNLALNSVDFAPEQVLPGSQLPIELEVSNKGQLPVDQVQVEVSQGGQVNSTVTLTQSIKPGETKILNGVVNLPPTISKSDYSVKVTPIGGEDYDLSDNTQAVTIGYTDLALDLTKYEIGKQSVVTATISNLSQVPTGAVLKVTDGSTTGNVLFEKRLDNVAAGTNLVESFVLDPQGMNFTDDNKQLYFSLQADATELSMEDNSDFLVIHKPVPEVSLKALGNLDTPADGASLTGQVNLSGWYLDGEGVNKVEVLVDGQVQGEAAYGDSRPDVESAYPDYNNQQAGFHYALDTSTLTSGSHTLILRETSLAGTQNTLPSRTIVINRAFGNIDSFIDGQKVSGKLNVSGWFLDAQGVNKLEVLVDDQVVGEAVYGDSRPDVYAAFPSYNNQNSGYHYELDATKLTPGSHAITIRETSTSGGVTTLPARSITVAEPDAKGYLDAITDGEAVSGILPVSGWFLDSTGVSKVEVLIDDQVVGEATYGDSRPDVYAAFPGYNNANSGYHYDLNTLTLTPGSHALTIRETSENGVPTTLPARNITVMAVDQNPKGCLDNPGEGAAVSGSITVDGWFLDYAGVSRVQVLVDGVVQGTAVLGDERPDVYNAFPGFNNHNAGFHYSLDTGKLTPGAHTVQVKEISNTGTELALPGRNINVSLVTRAFMDTPIDGETISGAVNVSGWVLDANGVAKLEVLVDGKVVGQASYGDLREDVYNAFPNYNSKNSGFHYSLDATSLTPGNHTLALRETTVGGAQVDLAERSVNVIN